jgi:hypothetical protein
MNKRVYLVFILLAFTVLACSADLGGGGANTEDNVNATLQVISMEQTSVAIEATSEALDGQQQASVQETTVAATVAAAIQKDGGASGSAGQDQQQTPPTDTPQPQGRGSAGSFERERWDPADGWGDPHDLDSFDSRDELFGDFSAGASRAWYGDDGRLHLTFTTRSRYVWSWSFITANDFYADVVAINGDKCVDRDSGGILFRGGQFPWDLGYMFVVSCGGSYNMMATGGAGGGGNVWPIINGVYETRGAGYGWKNSSEINTGPGAVNRIGVRAAGGNFDMYINGVWVDQFSYWALPGVDQWPGGQFALILGTGQKNDATISYDDFSIWYQ